MFQSSDFAEQSDEDLLVLLRNGEEKAFDFLYIRYRNKLTAVAFSRIRSKEHAEEIVQDIFTDIWLKRQELSIRHTFAAYVYTAVKYKVFDYISSLKVKDRYVQEMSNFFNVAVNTTEEQVDFNELDYHINNSINNLPEKCKEVFTLSRFENYSVNQIAEKLNVSPDTAKYHIAHALKKLRSNLRHMLTIALCIIAVC